jgi:hypothetical protein
MKIFFRMFFLSFLQKVTARMNKKLSGVNNDIKKQLELHAQQREQRQEKINNQRARKELCNEVIRSAMV